MTVEAVFWATTAAVVVCWLARLARGDLLNWLTFIVLGVEVPLVLFLQKWSTWTYPIISHDFFMIFIMFNLMLLVVFVVENFPGSQSFKLDMSPFGIEPRPGRIPVVAVNAAMVAIYLLENRLSTGAWFPARAGLADHVFHSSGLVYLTNSQYFILVVDLLFYFTLHRLRYLAYAAVLVVLPVLTRSARMDSAVEVVALCAFGGYYALCQAAPARRRLGRRLAAVAVAVVAAVGLVSLMVQVGIARMNNYGEYDALYSEYIGYTGPSLFGEFGAWYYGYFAMPFNNLNYNIIFKNPNSVSAWGLNSFRALYYGVFHVSWFGVPTDIANTDKIEMISASNVATGFWDFWYDYRLFSFVPMVVSAVLYLAVKRLLCRPNRSIVVAAVFFYWVSLWSFMSFQNTVYFDMVSGNIVLTALLVSYYFGPSTIPGIGQRELRRRHGQRPRPYWGQARPVAHKAPLMGPDLSTGKRGSVARR